MSLAVKATGRFGGTQSKLCRCKELSALAVILPGVLDFTLAVLPTDRVAGRGAESLPEVAAGGQEGPQVVEADGPLATDALAVPVTDAAGLAQGDAAGGARPLSQGAPEATKCRCTKAEQEGEGEVLHATGQEAEEIGRAHV